MKHTTRLLIALLCLLLYCLPYRIYAQCKIDYSNYKLVFEENFDNITDINQLTNHWMFHHDDPGWGWGDVHNDDGSYQSYGEYYDQGQVSVIPEQGILRLTADRVPATPVWSTYINAYRYPVYRSGMIQLRRDVTGYPFDGCNGSGGFTYGMFEIRMKIPKGATFPAFWLIGPTQFNVYEGKFGERQYGVGYDDEWTTDPTTGQHPGQSQWMNKLNWDDLGDNFHTYTGVWTPHKITFFFDGREICTFTGPTVDALQWYGGWCEANSIIVSMQMPGWSNVTNCHLDVDYIRVYKPIGNNYGLSYKSSSETMHHDAFDGISPAPQTVSSGANAIATNPYNANEVFYRGSNNYLFQAKNNGGSWQVTRMEFNDGPASPAAGDVRYLPQHDKVLYVGANNRINLFGRSTVEPCGFYHWYLRDDWWNGSYDEVAAQSGALQTAPNGDIFFKGTDSKMHRYYFSGGAWHHQVFTHPNSASLVGGDIVVDPATYNIMYRGADNRLQCFWKDAYGNYNQAWIDANWSTTAYTVKSTPGSMVWAPYLNGVLYIGADNTIHLYSWNTTWSHIWLPYSYNNPGLGYAGGDYALNSIDWDDHYKRVYYTGFDGRVQLFGMSGSSWWHGWSDDYWNTDEYSSFNSTQSSSLSASVKLGYDGPERSIFYTRKDNHLAYFKYEHCEVLNPPSGAWRNLNRMANTAGNTPAQMNEAIELYPNPVQATLHIKGLTADAPHDITILDMTGRTVLQQTVAGPGPGIDVSALAPGAYVLQISNDAGTSHHRFIKE